jgi:hypothetical protein
MLKKYAKVLAPLAAILMVWFMAGCPALLDPELGDLKGGPRETVENPPAVPEIPEIVIYGVRTLGFTAEGGLPGTTVAGAVAGTIFLGEEATAEDVTDLEFTYSQLGGYNLEVKYGVTKVSSEEPGEWQAESLIEGVFESGSYLVIEVTDTDLEDTEPNKVTYYKYLIAWGQNGAGIESITIGGRTFPITGVPYLGDDPIGDTGISSTTVYLTAAQIAAGRAISVGLRADSQKALVTWGPAWPANNTMPGDEFVDDPINAALANNSRIFVRVKSMNGDLWANYRIQVTSANQSIMGTLTAARASTSTLGTPSGSWNGAGLVDGAAINIKSPRLASAVAGHTGGTTAGTVTWAFAPNPETEPEFVPLAGLQDLAFGGYIYVRCENPVANTSESYINIYRFPVAEKPLSDDPALTGLSLENTVMNLGEPGSALDAAEAGEPIPVFLYQVVLPTVSWADTDADTVIAYGLIKGSTPPASYSPAVPAGSADGDTLVIRSTSESGSVILFYKVAISRKISDDATLKSITIAEIPATIAAPGDNALAAAEGSAMIYASGGGPAAPVISVVKFPDATVEYAKTSTASGTPVFSSTLPTNVALNECIWLRVTAENRTTIRYYKFTVNKINTAKVYGRGVPDPAWGAAHPDQVWPNLAANELLTFEKLPDVSYWNSKGHMHAFQDLFHFANGNAVEDLDDWMSRRKELQLIIGYYVRGYVPPIDADTIDISFNPAILTGSSPITVTHKASGRTETIPITINTSSLTGDRTKWGRLTAGPFSSGSDFHTGTLTLTDRNRAQVATLYGIPTSANHAPSRDSAGGWTVAVALTAIEGIDLNGDGIIDRETESLYGGWMDPKKALGFTGGSTGGKQAAGRGVLGISRQGTTAGVTNPSSSGCFGYTLERFFTSTGYRVDTEINGLRNPNTAIANQTGPGYGWPADPLPLGGAGVGASWGDLVGAPWYLKAIAVGDPIRGSAATSGYTLPVYGTNSASGRRARAVRGWSPYFEDFSNVPNNSANFGTKATNIAQPYIAWKTPGYSDNYSGIQGWGEGRSEDRSSRQWSSNALDQFTDLHYGLRVDTVVNDPHTSEGRVAGVICTVPADLHFELALAAPNIIVADDGYITPRCHPQSQWAIWLMIDEVYKFYGEQEGSGQLDTRYPNSGLYDGWDKYVWRNGIWMNWATHLASTGEKTAGIPYIYNAVVHGTDTTDAAMADWNISKFRDSPWSADDPASRFDFYRMDWGRPRPGGKLANTTDAPTIAERVHRLVDPILADYYKGEMYHVKPAINDPAVDASTYHDAAKAAIAAGTLVLNGPRFRETDWRGLLDNPETLTP